MGGGGVSQHEGLVATFFHIGAFFLRFSLFVFFFHRLKAFLLLFSLCGGIFATFSPYEESFSPCGGTLVTFFLHVEVLFCFYGDPFLAFSQPPPPPKFRRGPMPSCPLTPMSNMQFKYILYFSTSHVAFHIIICYIVLLGYRQCQPHAFNKLTYL